MFGKMIKNNPKVFNSMKKIWLKWVGMAPEKSLESKR